MSSQFLFAYGTLKSDQPEHAHHCLPPLSITPAQVPGSLWRLREGYPILQIAPSLALLDASKDPAADWAAALALQESERAPAIGESTIEGELFEYPLTALALEKMDRWENFVPGSKGPYQRRAIWVYPENSDPRVAWAYVCYTPPDWATLLGETRWNG